VAKKHFDKSLRMKILITGANGLVGQHLVTALLQLDIQVIGVGKGPNRLEGEHRHYAYHELDISDGVACFQFIVNQSPDIIVHGAAMTQVDECELDKPSCYNINVSATRFLIDAARVIKCKIIYLSTDFIFDGLSGPYKEEDIPSPVNYYGSTKLVAETAVMESNLRWAIVRTVLVYGQTLPSTRSNIVNWVKKNLEEKKHIKVVSDQQRTPTYVNDLVRGILLIITRQAEGIFHISGKEMLSPYHMALKIASHLNLNAALLEKVDSSTFQQAAPRPMITGFDISKARKQLGYEPRSFEESLKEMFG
jgi:dTDP-4-dehydrorhamnose reductase